MRSPNLSRLALVAGACQFFVGATYADPVEITIPIVQTGTEWRYWDQGTRPAGWQTFGFDDSAWPSGPSELGYGDGDEATVVANNGVAVYLRATFEIAEGLFTTALELRLKRDDGATIYLDGQEILRSNMPGGAPGNETLASATAAGDGIPLVEVSLNPEILEPGAHVLAVEVHQSSPASSDMSFDLHLEGVFLDTDGDNTPGEPYGGDGIEADPFDIENAAQLLRLAHRPQDWGASINLVDDIDMSEIDMSQWVPIGSIEIEPFSGHFDGSTRTISNFVNLGGRGLFDRLIEGGRIDNVFLENVSVGGVGMPSVGALVSVSGGWIQNCRLTGGSVVGSTKVGGLIGAGGRVFDCHVSAIDVNGIDEVGGIAGGAGLVRNCSATDVDVQGEDRWAGGIVGKAETVEDCHVSGEVQGGSQVGGVAGEGNVSDSTANEIDVEATGIMVGGIVGETLKVLRCGVTGSVFGEGSVGGVAGRLVTSGFGDYGIFESFSRANVSSFGAPGDVGGVVGYLNDQQLLLQDCYALGFVSAIGGGAAGGLIGFGSETSFRNGFAAVEMSNENGPFGGLVGRWTSPWGETSGSFWNLDTTQTTIAAGLGGEELLEGVAGLTTADLQNVATFEAAGWDLQTIWTQVAGNYPRLRWELGVGSAFAGAGTEADPFQIIEENQLLLISERPADWDKHFVLVGDLDFEGIDLSNRQAIGSQADRFTGSFDGGGHTISNLTIIDQRGLFGVTSGTLCDITLVGPHIISQAQRQVGALVGDSQGTLKNCHVIDAIVDAGDDVGGLAGSVNRAEDCSAQNVDVTCIGDNAGGLAGVGLDVERCWSSGEVRGEDDIGGLLGKGSQVRSSFSRANVLSEEGKAGGLVGTAIGGSPHFRHCYATGTVATEDNGSAGGLVGLLIGGSFHQCFATGRVPHPADGGSDDITGGLGGGVIDWTVGEGDSFWDLEASEIDRPFGTSSVVPPNGSFVGLTTDEAQTIAPYIDAGWDFVGVVDIGTDDIWQMFPGEPDYPHLWWEPAPPAPDEHLIPAGSTWAYWDEGTRPDGFTTAGFDFTNWPTGNARLGSGEGDEATEIDSGITTAYFAKAFQVDQLPATLEIGLLSDDGAIVYINSQEVIRSNMPPGPIGNDTFATAAVGGAAENEFISHSVGGEVLQVGENLIAVEVHQVSANSSDLSFDLLLKGSGIIEPESDSDDDGLLDEWEVAHFGDLSQDPDDDPDGDGFSNLREFEAGTDPNNPDSPQRGDLEKLVAANPTVVDNNFGESVAISRRTLAVGAPGEAFDAVGEVHLFKRKMMADGGGGGGGEVTPAIPPANASPLFGLLVISEVMYNPDGPTDAEFIELLNLTASTLDLGGLTFTAGVVYTFGPGNSISPGGRITINPEEYDGTLSNAGEILHLTDAAGGIIVEINYDDAPPWPAEADGGGRSLVLRQPFTNPDALAPGNWTISSVAGGTPGGADPDAENSDGGNGDDGGHHRPRWVEVAHLKGDDFGAINFGADVALHRNTLVVAAREQVFVFERDGDDSESWSKVAELDTDDTAPAFFPRVAIHGRTILVRAFYADPQQATVLVFEKRDGSWTHTDTLDSPEPQENDKFGVALALHRNTAAAGSACGTFVFQRNPFTRAWRFVKKIEQRDDDEAQVSMAVQGFNIVVASQDTDGEGEPTLANVYHRFAGGFDNWGRVTKLPAPQDDPDFVHDYDVAIRGGTIVAGSPLSSEGLELGETAGLVYIYKRRLRGARPWVLDRTLLPAQVTVGSRFGASVGLSGNQIVAGSPNTTQHPDPAKPGCAYVFPNNERSRFRAWLAHFFTVEEMDDPEIAELSADPDDDGLINEIEFALGLDPTVPNEDEDFLPSISSAVAGEPGEECLNFTFSIPEAMPDGMIYEVQVAEQLDGWHVIGTPDIDGNWAGDAEVVEHVAEDGRVCITVHDTTTMAEGGTRFMRLGVRGVE